MSLEETVASLASDLRRQGRSVGVEETIDATNALRIIGTSDVELYTAAIKTTLVKDFDLTSKQDNQTPNRRETILRYGAENQRIGRGIAYPDENAPESSTGARPFEFGIYSPHAIEPEQRGPKISRIEERRWLVGILKFRNSILTVEGHRRRKQRYGEIDPRRTMQYEVKKAGDSPSVFRSVKKISKASIVLLCDVSGSMSDSNSTIVNACWAFKRAIPRSEIFLFSTKLRRITFYAARFAPHELARRIPKLDLGFGGGTKIGQCLQKFRLSYGAMLTSRTTVVTFSDGWDIGDVTILRREMIELQRRTSRVIWINPLLGSKDCSAETLGMKTALDYVDAFISPGELLNF
jgi:uncharacterized protein